ncbi:hypothetical protein M5K25_026349 [Dendrobium thyrsiflorum]|uniref:Uncharacterized protein n=1 Tax=Dendrobium thyrsiflorum TaxID=117978 RepID=A0ABD0TX30_DENTH
MTARGTKAYLPRRASVIVVYEILPIDQKVKVTKGKILNGRMRSDSTSQDVAESLAALSTQQVIRKTVVAEPPFQQMDDEELSNLSSLSLTNSSKPD